MDIEQIRDHCLCLPYAVEGFPFDEHTLVFKVGSKMFGYILLNHSEPYICLKCDPDRAIELRERYDAVVPAWHMNKVHWNGIYVGRNLSPKLILELIRHSYELVYLKLSKRERTRLEHGK